VCSLGERKEIDMDKLNIIRHAENNEKDCRFIHKVRNTEDIRNVSWNTQSFPYKSHKNWYSKNYKSIYIIQPFFEGEYIGVPKGYVRVNNGEISIAILKEYRDQNLGSLVLKEITELYPELRAEVKIDNMKSLCFFIKNNFRIVGMILKYIDRGDKKI